MLERELKAIQSASEPSPSTPLLALGLSAPALDAVHGMFERGVTVVENPSLPAAMLKTAAAVLAGTESPWIELRRTGWAKRPLPWRPRKTEVVGRGSGLPASGRLCGGLDSCRSLCGPSRSRERARGRVRETFPGTSVPVGVVTRLASEYRKLAATKGSSEDKPQLHSVVRLLYEVLASLPRGLRYRLLEIYLEPGQVRLEGEIRRHGDADLLAAGLRNRGFLVTAPRHGATGRSDRGRDDHGVAGRGITPRQLTLREANAWTNGSRNG